MIDGHTFALFCLASLALIFTPGPDIIYVLTRGVAQGRDAALAAAAGFSLGNIAHTLLASLGVSALIVASATAFQAVKLAGAVYLVYLGIRLFRAGDPATAKAEDADAGTPALWAVFRQSVIANVLNPKVAVFFLAFFPQFIDHEAGNGVAQMLLLGLAFVVLTFLGFGLVALLSGSINRLFIRRPGASRLLYRGAGAVLVGLGLKLAWPENWS